MDIQLPFDSPKYLSRRSPSSGLSMSVSPRSPSWKEWFRKVRGLQRHEDQCTERKVFNRNESRKRCTVAGVKDCALRRVVMMCHGGWAETYLACCRLRESPVRPALQTLTPPNLIIPPMNDLDLIPLADTISQFPVTRATAAFLSDEGLRILLCSLSGKIKKIRLGGLKITEKGWRILAAFISMNEQLQSLEIRETLIVEGVVACLVEAINKSSLDRLSLRKCGPMTARVFQETNVPFIGIGGDQGILEILPHKTKIRGISISEIPMNNLDWLLPLCPMLVELELRKCSITSDLLNPILDKLENIERVGLAANDIFPGVRIDKLCNCEILDISETPIASLDGLVGEKMQVLRLYNTSISNDQILEAVQSSKLIRVEKNNLDPSVAEICLKHMAFPSLFRFSHIV
ncbi:hypothetical protein NEOLI_004386 [Neolecta irregularis DAH-3]|uniref:Uncharacterized protein n=1 Tax=Neolecta irregularis (strain DAH-3) TaxID=1198029 RepID=A0A1U7LPI8_NEOID|nr:hypothetical protein NEOLI_004386 [Neolecta irregularis DAH-3]|eukprot:OLL24503.1 hypothetical protein NEOLI_004386 [Neolecta irregularis DAH-3]